MIQNKDESYVIIINNKSERHDNIITTSRLQTESQSYWTNSDIVNLGRSMRTAQSSGDVEKLWATQEDCTDGVNVFYARAAVTQNARSPIVECTMSWDVGECDQKPSCGHTERTVADCRVYDELRRRWMWSDNVSLAQRFNKTFNGWQNLWNFWSFKPCCSYLLQTHSTLWKKCIMYTLEVHVFKTFIV